LIESIPDKCELSDQYVNRIALNLKKKWNTLKSTQWWRGFF